MVSHSSQLKGLNGHPAFVPGKESRGARPAVSLVFSLPCTLTSTYRDARRGDRTGYHLRTLNSI